MVFQSLLSSSISSTFHSSVTSVRSGLGQIGTNNSPPKSFDLSAWRTFDRVSVQDGNCSSREQVMERNAIVVGKKCTGWEGYLVQAERRCTEELCDWQVNASSHQVLKSLIQLIWPADLSCCRTTAKLPHFGDLPATTEHFPDRE